MMSASEDLLHQSRCVTLSGVVRTPCAARLQRPQAAYGYQWLCRSISRLVKEIAERRLIGGDFTFPPGGPLPAPRRATPTWAEAPSGGKNRKSTRLNSSHKQKS